MAEADSLRSRVLRGFSSVVVGDLISRGLGYLLLPVYLHWMDKAQVGDFTYAIAFIGSLSQLAMMGLYTGMSKLHGEMVGLGRERTLAGSVLLGTMLPVLAFAGLLALWPVPVGWLVSDPQICARVAPLVPLGILSTALTFLYTNFLTASGRFRLASVFVITRAVLGNAFALWVLSAGAEDQAQARLTVIFGVDLLVFFAFSVQYGRHVDLRFAGRDLWRRLVTISFPIWLNSLLGLPLSLMDRLMLDRGSREVMADYNVACQLTLPLLVLFSSFNSVWFPSVLARTDPRAVLDASRRMVWLVAPALALLGVVLAGMVWGLISFGVLPAKYGPVLPLLLPLVLAQVLGAVAQLLAIPFFALERTWIFPLVNVPVAILFIVLCAWLIPTGGAPVAAWLQQVPPAITIVVYAIALATNPRLKHLSHA